MEILGTPSDEFMQKITSESVNICKIVEIISLWLIIGEKLYLVITPSTQERLESVFSRSKSSSCPFVESYVGIG